MEREGGGASELFNKGFAMETIGKLGRWKGIDSVKLYCDMTDKQKKELSKALFKGGKKPRRGHAY